MNSFVVGPMAGDLVLEFLCEQVI